MQTQFTSSDNINFIHMFTYNREQLDKKYNKAQKKIYNTPEEKVLALHNIDVERSNLSNYTLNQLEVGKSKSRELWSSPNFQQLSSCFWTYYTSDMTINNNNYVPFRTCISSIDHSLHLRHSVLENPNIDTNLVDDILTHFELNDTLTQQKPKSKSLKEKREASYEARGLHKRDYGELDVELKNPVNLKVSLYPDKETATIFKQYLGCCRTTRNNALYLSNVILNYAKKETTLQEKADIIWNIQQFTSFNLVDTRDVWIWLRIYDNMENVTTEEKDMIRSWIKNKVVTNTTLNWLTDCYACIRNDAVEQLSKDINATIQRRKNNPTPNQRPFYMHYKHKNKLKSETFVVENRYVDFQIDVPQDINKKAKNYVKIYGRNIEYKDSPEVTAFLKSLVVRGNIKKEKKEGDKRYCKDCTIQYIRATNKFYILVPYQKGEFNLPSERRRKSDVIRRISQRYSQVTTRMALQEDLRRSSRELLQEPIHISPHLSAHVNSQTYSSATSSINIRMLIPQKRKIFSIDPGGREFLSGYDVNGRYVNLDIGFKEDTGKHYEKIIAKSKQTQITDDRYYTREKKIKNENNEVIRIIYRSGRISNKDFIKNKKKEICREYEKIRRIRHHHHYTTANYLLDKYEIIILPKFEVSKMIKRNNRKISKKTVQQLLSFSHSNFRERLIHKGGNRIITEEEEYTTVTCGVCGSYNFVGASKTYKCHTCQFECDRDNNSSRLIDIKGISKRIAL